MAIRQGSTLLSGSGTRVIKTSSGGTETTLEASETLDLTAGTNVTISEAAGVVTVNSTHPDITAASSSDNSGQVFIQDLTLDSNGHVTGIATATASGGSVTKSSIETALTVTSGESLELVGDKDGSTGASLVLYHESDSPANNDEVGRIDFKGENSSSQKSTYGEISVLSTNVTDGSERGRMQLKVLHPDSFDELGPTPIVSINHDHVHFAEPIRIGGNTTANELDDYEEGTWTPDGFNDAFTLTVDTNDRKYVKVGRNVSLFASVSFPTLTDSDAIYIEGIPFTIDGANGHIIGTINDNSSSDPIYFLRREADNVVGVVKVGGGRVNEVDLSGETFVKITMQYQTTQ